MLYKIASILAHRLCAHYQSEKYSVAVYIYGIQLLVSLLFSLCTMLFISGLLGQIPVTLIFLLVFLPMRNLCGGFHAKTFLRCFLYTNLTHVCVIGMVNILMENYAIIGAAIILVIADIVIGIWAPVKSRKKRGFDCNSKKERRQVMLALLICNIMYIISRILKKCYVLQYIIAVSLGAVAILMIISKIITGRRKCE